MLTLRISNNHTLIGVRIRRMEMAIESMEKAFCLKGRRRRHRRQQGHRTGITSSGPKRRQRRHLRQDEKSCECVVTGFVKCEAPSLLQNGHHKSPELRRIGERRYSRFRLLIFVNNAGIRRRAACWTWRRISPHGLNASAWTCGAVRLCYLVARHFRNAGKEADNKHHLQRRRND